MTTAGPPEALQVDAVWAYTVFMTPSGHVVAAVDRSLLGDGIRALRAPSPDEVLGSLAVVEHDIITQRIAEQLSVKKFGEN